MVISRSKLEMEIEKIRGTPLYNRYFFDRLVWIIEQDEIKTVKEAIECASVDIPDVFATYRISGEDSYTSKVFRGKKRLSEHGTEVDVVIKLIYPRPQISTFNQEQKFTGGFESVRRRNNDNYDMLAGVLKLENIVRQKGFGIHGDDYCWFIYYDAGPTLREYFELHPEERRNLIFILECFISLTGTLAGMHQNGIAHRDLKPANVYVQERGGKTVAILGDYDTPRTIEEIKKAREINPIFESIGSPAYMSPEGCRDYLEVQKLVDEEGRLKNIPKGLQRVDWTKNDVYCVSCMLYESVTGKLPGKIENDYINLKIKQIGENMDGFYGGVNDDVSKLGNLPKDLIDLIRDCLSEENKRPTMENVNLRLQKISLT